MNFTDEKVLNECLNDIGCGNRETEKILKQIADGNLQEAIHLLRIHRKTILGNLHESEKQIDCLDYLVYSLEKEIGTK